MSTLTSWLWGTTQVDEAVDKATSELLPSGAEDIALNLEICDQIRSKAVPPKDAMKALKRRMNHKNPNVQLLALALTDVCIKNGGDHFLVEIASREYMDNLVSILKMPGLNHEVKTQLLRLIQNWATTFEGKPTLSYVVQVYKMLKHEGFTFPPKDFAAVSSAMVDTQTAPEWIDSDVCLRCRTSFSFTNRKHHCRNCGQVFDQECSSKLLPLPHFGITQDVRVCDVCHGKLTKHKKDKSHSIDAKARHSTSVKPHSARELADAELQRAIQLSLAEVNGRNGNARPGYVPTQPTPSAYQWQASEPPLIERSTRPGAQTSAVDGDDDDAELKAAIEASLREANAPKPSAPIVVETPRSEETGYIYEQQPYSQSYTPMPGAPQSLPAVPALPNYDLQPLELDAILTFSQTVEQVEAQGGRDMSRYPAVNELYDKANGLRPKLALALDDTDRKEKMLADMHDKLSQVVKLYDRALTEQVSRPWRSQSQAASTSQQSPYNQYNRWTSAPPPQVPTSPTLQRPALGYASTSQLHHVQQQQQSHYAQKPVQEPTYQPQQQQTYQWHPQQVTQPPPQHQPQQQYVAPTPVSAPPTQPTPVLQYGVGPPVFLHQSPPPQAIQFAPPPPLHHQQSPLQQYPPQLEQSPQPVQAPQQAQSPSKPYQFAPSEPITPSPAQPTLSRHNTMTYTPKPPAPLANFVASPPSVQAPPAPTPQQPAQYAAPSAPPTHMYASPPPPQASFPPQYLPQQQAPAPGALPHFPTAPTSNPQSYSLYGTGTPDLLSGVEQTERKEALLIDL